MIRYNGDVVVGRMIKTSWIENENNKAVKEISEQRRLMETIVEGK